MLHATYIVVENRAS